MTNSSRLRLIDLALMRRVAEGVTDPEDLGAVQVFPEIAAMFSKYPEGSAMFELLERAASAFGDAVQEVACRALAIGAIDDARRRARSEAPPAATLA